MSAPITGSCLCKAVKLRINGEVVNTANCHCSICKKITGAAFETVAVVNEAELEIFEGRKLLSVYRISANAEKRFCSRCGTPIYNIHFGHPGRALVHIGTLDNPTALTPRLNLHTEKMLPWVPEIATLTCFEQGFKK